MKKTFTIMCALALFTSCNCNFDMVTTVGKDGSLTRCFICPADSALVCGDTDKDSILPIEITDEWDLTWNTSKDQVRHTWPMTPEAYNSCRDTISLFVERKFSSAQEMSRDFQFDAVPVKPISTFEKKFKWFYTDFTFSETFPQPEFSVPVTDYLTQEEAMFWFTGNPIISQTASGSVMFENLSDIAQAVNKWFCANSLSDAFQYIADHYEDITETTIHKEDFVKVKDSFINQTIKQEGDCNPAEFSLEEAFSKYFNSPVYSEFIKEMNYSPEDSWWLNMNFTFSYSVVMPGKPIPSSGFVTNGNTQTINLNLGMIYPGGYTVTAKSRSYNIWTCIPSAIIIIISIILAISALNTKKESF